MKQKLMNAMDLIFESVYYLVLTYTLSSMAVSFNPHWTSLLFRLVNVFALTKFYQSIQQRTESHFWTWVIFFTNLAVFALLAWKFGYIKGVLTPFAKVY